MNGCVMIVRHVTCHTSRVKSHTSRVTYHTSRVTCVNWHVNNCAGACGYCGVCSRWCCCVLSGSGDDDGDDDDHHHDHLHGDAHDDEDRHHTHHLMPLQSYAFEAQVYEHLEKSRCLQVWGLGFRVWGLGFGVWGLGFGVSPSQRYTPCKAAIAASACC